MAEVRGRKCDRPGCTTFLTDSPTPPPGWIRIAVVVDKQVRQDGNEMLEYCGNYCAAYVLLDRYEAESGGKRLVRQPKKKGVIPNAS